MAVSDEDRYLEGTAQYFWFADRFGWLPEQVDEQPLWVVDRLPAVAKIHDEVTRERQEAAQRSS